jgi:hypothetical protein
MGGEIMTAQDDTYLGDGAYYRYEHGTVCLTTQNGIDTTNEIFLESEVVQALVVALVKTYGAESITRIVQKAEEL